MAEIASAFVSILPSFRGGASALSKQLDGPAATAGKTGGKAYSSAFSSSFKGLVVGLGATFAAAKTVDVFKDSVREASNLNESINAVRVSYGKAAADILKIGKNAAVGFGLSRSEFNGFAVQFQSFSKTIAGVDGDVSKTFESIIGRATDFASVMNLGVNEAATLFQSGLAGETEPLRRFGIDLSAATVEAYALSSGLVKNKSELTEAMKVQARYGSLMEQTSKFQGDWNNTSNQAAGQQKILSAQVKELKASFGSALIPILTKVALVLNNGVIPALRGSAKFVKSNATTIKVLGITIGSFFLPYLIASTVAFVTNAVSVAATTAAWVAYGLIVKSTAISTQIFTAAQWLLNAALTANPIGLVIVALVALGAGLYLLWTKSETFRKIVTGAFDAVKSAAVTAFNWVKANWPLLLAIITGPIGLAVLAVVKNWEKIKAGARAAVSGVTGFFKALPGNIKAALGDLGSTLLNAGKQLITGFLDGIKSKFKDVKNTLGDLTGKLTSWKGPASLDKVILKSSGQLVIDGFITGLQSRYPRVQASLGDLTSGLSASVAVPAGARFDSAASIAGPNGDPHLTDLSDSSINRLAEAILAGATRVAHGLDDRRDYTNTVKTRVPGAYAGSLS